MLGVLIDTHTHIVSADLEGFPQQPSSLANGDWWADCDCSAEALRDGVNVSGVSGVVLVQAAGPYGDDNSYLTSAVGALDHRFAAAGIVDPAAAAPSTALRALAEQPGVAGVRLFHIPTPSRPWLGTSAADDLIDTAAGLGLSISICCLPDTFSAVHHHLARRADVAFVLEHCGFADFSGEPPYPGAAALWALAQHANVHLKFTPTAASVSGADPASLLREIVDRFGARRVVWGSDWPQHREVDGYTDQVDRIASWLDHLPTGERRAVAWENALRLWPAAWPHLRGGPG